MGWITRDTVLPSKFKLGRISDFIFHVFNNYPDLGLKKRKQRKLYMIINFYLVKEKYKKRNINSHR